MKGNLGTTEVLALPHIPTSKAKLYVYKIALATLRGLGKFGKGSLYALRPIGRAIGALVSIIIRFIILPIYQILLIVRLRVSRLLISARGFFFLLFTNRYVFHAALLAISIPVIVSQLQAKSATAMDVGQHSVLYALVTDDRDAVMEETVHPEGETKNSRYLGADTIQAMPAIDFDYEQMDQSPVDLTIPGSIAIRPMEPGVTSTQSTDITSPIASAPEPAQPRSEETRYYTIKSGDALATIANKFGVTVGTLIWANNLTERSILRIGDSLKIPPVSGVLHLVKRGDTIASIANKYGVETSEIYDANHLTKESILTVGKELIVPGGTPPVPIAVKPAKPTTKPTTVAVRPDIPLTRITGKALDLYQEIVKTPDDTRSKPPDADLEKAADTKLLWPTRLHIINQYYGWKHTGVDFDGDYTDPIYASEDGIVEKAGWNNSGYGLMILIDHQNGYKTRYGHGSKIFVQEGDKVKRGQVIAMVGTTGRSTGTHLHYEVYKNGKRVNPLAYIK